MSHFLKKLYCLFFYGLATLIILFALGLGGLRIATGVLNKNTAYVSSWASTLLHQPVHVGEFSAKFHRLLPRLTLSNVSLLDEKTHQPVLLIHHISIQFGLLDSLLSWHWHLAHLSLSGVTLNIYKHSAASVRSLEQKKLQWLLMQPTVSLKSVTLMYHINAAQAVTLYKLHIHIVNQAEKHQLALSFRFKPAGGVIHCVMHFQGDDLRQAFKHSMLYLQLTHVALASLQYNWSIASQFFNVSTKANNRLSKIINAATGVLSLKGWITLSNQHISNILGNFLWALPAQNKMTTRGKFFFSCQGGGACPRFVVYHMSVHHNQNTWPMRRIIFYRHKLYMNAITLQELMTLRRFVAVKMAWVKQLDVLKPKGLLTNFLWQASGWRADFTQLHFSPWHHMPGISGASGSLSQDDHTLSILLNAHQFTLTCLHHLKTPLVIHRAIATVDITTQLEHLAIHVPALYLHTSSASFLGEAQYVTQKNHHPLLSILGRMQLRNAADMPTYLAVSGLSPTLAKWIKKAIQSIRTQPGTILFRGAPRVFPFAKNSGVFTLSVPVEQLNLNYARTWPMLLNAQGHLFMHNNRFTLSAGNGEVGGSRLKNLTVNIPRFSHPTVHISFALHNTLKSMQSLANVLPVSIPSFLKKSTLSGSGALTMNVALPLFHQKADIKAQLTLSKATACYPASPKLSNVSGMLMLHNRWMSGRHLTATMYHKVWHLTLNTQQKKHLGLITTFTATGKLPVNVLSKEVPVLRPMLTGVIPVKAKMSLYWDDPNRHHILLTSSLKGVGIRLYQLYRKKALSLVPLHVSLAWNSLKNMVARVAYGKALQAVLYQPRTHQHLSLALYAGKARLIKQPGVFIKANFSQPVFWSHWRPLVDLLKKQGGQKTRPLSVALTAKSLFISHQVLHAVSADLNRKGHRWQADINSKEVSGHIILHNRKGRWSMKGVLKNLHLSPFKNSKPSHWHLAWLDKVSLAVKDFSYGATLLGKSRINAHFSNNSLHIKALELTPAGCHFSTVGRWQINNHLTQAKGDLSCDDFGRFLSAYSVTDAMRQGEGKMTFSAEWPGSPLNVSPKNMVADLKYYLTDGMITHLDKQAKHDLGVGKLLNIFNLKSLPQQLLGGFKNLSDSGFEFNVMQGEMKFSSGVASLIDTQLDGPVAHIAAAGHLNFNHKQYDIRLTVLPYLTSSIPLIATVAGGPVVGAITWLADSVVNPVVGKAAEKVLHLKGSWDTPSFIALPKPAALHSE